ncbi:MAG: hypothetical protein WDM76_00615 [Limisphaerales bacterium]
MNDLNLTPAAPEDLSAQIAALRRQVFTLLLALIVVSGTLTVYLYRQARLTGKDLANLQPQAKQVITAFNQNRAAMESFMQQLNAYALTHPDFQPVLRKYGWAPAASTNPAPKK